MQLAAGETELLRTNVKFKKRQGVLQVTNHRLLWLAEAVEIDVPWSMIAKVLTGKVKPGVNKCMMRIETLPGANGGGKKNQIILEFFLGPPANDINTAATTRDQVKGFIEKNQPSRQTAAQQPKPKPPSLQGPKIITQKEARSRAEVMSSDPLLMQQYNDLVVPGIVSEDEFWACGDHQRRLQNEKWRNQPAGMPSALVADVRANVNSSNIINYKISAREIHSIFVQYPAVHCAWKDNVPHRCSAQEFWVKYFKSKYFSMTKGRAHTHDGGGGANDMFDQYDTGTDMLPRQEQAKGGSLAGYVDPVFDLTITDGDRNRLRPEDVKDTRARKRTRPTGDEEESELATKRVINKLNRHSFLVMDSSDKLDTAAGGAGGAGKSIASAKGGRDGVIAADVQRESVLAAIERPDLVHGAAMEDHNSESIPLEVQTASIREQERQENLKRQNDIEGKKEEEAIEQRRAQQVEAAKKKADAAKKKKLGASKLSCFGGDDDDDGDDDAMDTDGTDAGAGTGAADGALTVSPELEARKRAKPDFRLGFPEPARALRALTSFGADIQNARVGRGGLGSSKPDMPPDFEEALKRHFVTVTELLRHNYSYALIEPKDPAVESKLVRIRDKLEAKLNELKAWRRELVRNQSVNMRPLVPQVQVIMDQIDLVFEREQGANSGWGGSMTPKVIK